MQLPATLLSICLHQKKGHEGQTEMIKHTRLTYSGLEVVVNLVWEQDCTYLWNCDTIETWVDNLLTYLPSYMHLNVVVCIELCHSCRNWLGIKVDNISSC